MNMAIICNRTKSFRTDRY